MQRTGIIVALIIVLALYATNPTKTEFNEFAEEFIKVELQKSGVTSNSFLNNLISAFAGQAVSKVSNIMVTRDEYYLFSVYKVEGVNIKYNFIGILRKFVPINKHVNSDKINQLFKDVIAVLNDEIDLKEDYYRAQKVVINNPSEITVNTELISGPPSEVLFLDYSNYELWQQRIQGHLNTDMKYYPALSMTINGTATKSGQVDMGTYYFVFENTDFGQVMPPMNFADDISLIKAEITIKELN